MKRRKYTRQDRELRRFTRRNKRLRRYFCLKGGGGAGSKPALARPPPPPPPSRSIVFFDVDDTLIFHREIFGQSNLHDMRVRAGLAPKIDDPIARFAASKAKIDDVMPRPDFFVPEASRFIYLRPHVIEALEYAKAHADAIYAFSASVDPSQILSLTGLDSYFKAFFGRAYTKEARANNGMFIFRKNLAAMREHLKLSERDKVYIIDDHPEWIDVSPGGNDHIIGVPSFQPSYKLYGVQVIKYPHQDDPSDTIPNENILMDVLRIIFP